MSTAKAIDQAETAFRQVYTALKKHGKVCSPRGQKVIELEHFTYELPAYARFASFAARKFKPDYVRREFLWYLRGNARDLTITQHAKLWQDIVNQDQTINSNYGQYIFARREAQALGHAGTMPYNVARSPFEYVVGELIQDVDSRRAAIPILSTKHISMVTKDVPCTYSLSFRVREGRLNMSVHMRSQDAIFGMGNDAPCFSFIHEMVFNALLDPYPELQLGVYRHTADSFHVYERHFEMLDKIIDGDEYEHVQVPRMAGPDEVRHLVFGVHSRYEKGRHAWCFDQLNELRAPKMAYEVDKAKSYSGFKFSNWLLEPELADQTTHATTTTLT